MPSHGKKKPVLQEDIAAISLETSPGSTAATALLCHLDILCWLPLKTTPLYRAPGMVAQCHNAEANNLQKTQTKPLLWQASIQPPLKNLWRKIVYGLTGQLVSIPSHFYRCTSFPDGLNLGVTI